MSDSGSPVVAQTENVSPRDRFPSLMFKFPFNGYCSIFVGPQISKIEMIPSSYFVLVVKPFKDDKENLNLHILIFYLTAFKDEVHF